MLNPICKNCKHWERLYVQSYYNRYYMTEQPDKIYEDYTDYPSTPCCTTIITKKNLGKLKQKTGTCCCDKFIYDIAETCHPHYIEDQKTDALYYCDGEEYSAWFTTGEDFGCIHFRRRE